MNGYFSFLPKMLEKHLWNSFSLYLLVPILQFVHEISSFSGVLYNRGVLKNFSKFTDKLKKHVEGDASKKKRINKMRHSEVFCQKLFLQILQNSQKNISVRISFLIKLQAANLKLSEAATGDVQSNKVRSSRPDLFCKKDVIKHFVKFTGKHLCQSLVFNNVSLLTLFKIRLWHWCFLLHFAKFLRTPFHTEQLWWLLL